MRRSDRQGKVPMNCNSEGKQSTLEVAGGSKVKICVLKQGVRKSFQTKRLIFPMGKTMPLTAS